MSGFKTYKLVGKKIVDIRPLNQEELDVLGWDGRRGDMNYAIVLDDGSVIFSSMDPEGNGPGCTFINGPGKDEGYYLSEDLK